MRYVLRASLLVLAVLASSAPASAQGLVITTADGTGWVCLPAPTSQYATLSQIVTDYHTLGGFRYPAIIHERFVNNCRRQPGDSLGGDIETFESTATLTFTDADGKDPVTVSVPVHAEAHTSKQDLTARQQSIDTTMNSMEGQVDNTGGWERLAITAGDAHGLPSPGVTTLTRLPDGRVVVDSKFNIRYRFEYKGTPGGPFDGLEGSSEGEVLMYAQPASNDQEGSVKP